MLVRWFVDRKSDSLGREWPAGVTLTLEGRAAAGTFLQRLQATYGREQELVEDGVYPYVGLRRSVEYDRIARFSGLANNTVTVSWLWKADTLIGGWITPSLRAAPTEYGAYETKTTLRLPFDGEWLVTGGGRKPTRTTMSSIPPCGSRTISSLIPRAAPTALTGRITSTITVTASRSSRPGPAAS